jgi:peptide/nickel transport system ATP-binding protein
LTDWPIGVPAGPRAGQWPLRRRAFEVREIQWASGPGPGYEYSRAAAIAFSFLSCVHKRAPSPVSATDATVGDEADARRRIASHGSVQRIKGVEYSADRVAVMNRGRIEECGDAQAVLARPRSDYTRALLAAVPRIAASNRI